VAVRSFITFCQEYVVTSTLGQSMSMAKTAEVASLKVRPLRSSAIQSALGTHTPEVVPFHVKMMSWSWYDLKRKRELRMIVPV